jgi:hypothetical protein
LKFERRTCELSRIRGWPCRFYLSTILYFDFDFGDFDDNNNNNKDQYNFAREL